MMKRSIQAEQSDNNREMVLWDKQFADKNKWKYSWRVWGKVWVLGTLILAFLGKGSQSSTAWQEFRYCTSDWMATVARPWPKVVFLSYKLDKKTVSRMTKAILTLY